jgi:hypothetical protein
VLLGGGTLGKLDILPLLDEFVDIHVRAPRGFLLVRLVCDRIGAKPGRSSRNGDRSRASWPCLALGPGVSGTATALRPLGSLSELGTENQSIDKESRAAIITLAMGRIARQWRFSGPPQETEKVEP